MVMPGTYSVLENDEMMYLDGGEPISISALVGLVMAVGGAGYGGGYAAGTRVAWMSSKKDVSNWYQSNKWPIRGVMVMGFGILGGITMLGFENGLYTTLSSRS